MKKLTIMIILMMLSIFSVSAKAVGSLSDSCRLMLLNVGGGKVLNLRI